MTSDGFAICAIFRDEAPYLKEWIEFHIQEGAQHFYLYDNFSTDNPEHVLRPFVNHGVVTLINWPVRFVDRGQEKAYDDCIKRSKSTCRWLVFIDIDEFLFSPQSNVSSILQTMTEFPAVAVNTICYGTNGNLKYTDQPVIDRFTRRAPLWWKRNLQRKIILQPKSTLRAITPHRFEFLVTGGTVNLKGVLEAKDKRLLPRFIYRLSKQIISYRLIVKMLPSWVALLLDPYGGLKPHFGGVTKLRINHYVLRSREEYFEKQRRFESSQHESKYDDPYFWYHDQNQIYDPVLANRVRARSS